MKKLDLKKYQVEVVTEEGKKKLVDYDVMQSLVGLLLHPDLKLNGLALLEQNELAGKLILNEGKEMLLEDSEYEKIKRPFDVVTGFNKNDVELVRRVLKAETVEVAEKKKQ